MVVGALRVCSVGTAMRSTQRLRITLPDDLADALRAKVASGEYATESDVIREALGLLFVRDRVVETWLRERVAESYGALKADPSRGVGVATAKGHLAGARKRGSAKK
jgi:Arc/MetJ-type ribon-helix-helix transcriptional regulator